MPLADGPLGGGDDWSIDVVSDTRGPAIDITKTYDGGPITYHFIAVWDDSAWPTPIPQRPWVTAAGASFELQGPFAGPVCEIATPEAVWSTLGAAIVDWFSIAVVGTSVEILDTQLNVVLLIEIQLGTFVFLFDSDTATPSYLVWSAQYNKLDDGDLLPYQFVGAVMYQPAIAQVANVQANGQALARAAEALELIAMQDIEVSVNHNAYMWSIRGKVRVG